MTIDPELLKSANEALSKAKIQLMGRENSVFFATICFSLKYQWDLTIPTAAVDGITMWINPEFFLGLSPEERLFVLVHECMHVALLHTLRLMARIHRKFNEAADHVINLMLLERGFKMPDWVLKDPQYKGMSTEQVYDLLPDPDPNKKPQMGDDIRQSPGDAEKVQQQIEDILVRASIQSKMAEDKPGTIPGEIEVFLNRLLNPKLPWNKILQKYLHSFAKNDYTWRKPNRRFFPGHHLPSLYSESLMNIAVAVDISASVTDDQFLRFVTETHSILRMMKPEKITLIQFDTEIKSTHEIRSVQELMQVKFTGRGGTQINPVLEWANDHKPQLLLVFTDGGFYFYTLETKVKTLWLIHDNLQFNAPFGKTIHYSMKDPA